MQMPPRDPDTLFEDLLQDLPPETTSNGTGIQSLCAGEKGQDSPATLTRGLFILRLG